MNKKALIVGIVTICLLIVGATGRRWEPERSYPTLIYTATYSGAQTQFAAIVAPTGISLFIDKIIWSAATATWIYFNDTGINATSDVDYGYAYSGTNASFLDNAVNIKLSADSTAFVTTGGAGYIHLEYHYE